MPGQIPAKARRAIQRVEKLRARFVAAQEDLQVANREAALLLTEELGMSYAEAGEVMGVSRARVHVLAKEGRIAAKARAEALGEAR